MENTGISVKTEKADLKIEIVSRLMVISTRFLAFTE